ncbi:hypothetical protein GALMADRAFT_134980 [Galerina marginata CBS 339.88]|uniref:Zn(2)-C6 fungal-type domain-containing protein n=1 Tax=Galerina marginata (strain CBS 339.88) TaxID=685588 RepID=A0A067TNR7_GALM3|nr:hypothetical protein GALMADRAFT_134980 [Galerina marginata CBS 339.88]
MPSQRPTPGNFRFPSDDDNGGGLDVHEGSEFEAPRGRSAQKFKPSGACVDCKSVKVRCEFLPGEKKCRRCQLKDLPCHPRERKKRKAADTHEELQERSHEQDLHIQNLLLQYDQRRNEQKVHKWVSKASMSKNDLQYLKWMHKGKSPESAVASHFSTGHGTQQLVPPPIVKHCALYPEDIKELFSIFFTRVNPYFSILDQNYHTPQKLIWNSPFLFTVLCAVASRYYSARPNMYSLAMEFARDCAGKGLVEGDRSVEVCQAYLIMAVYPMPKKKWIEDRSWLLMGVAIRMAIELGLNQPPPPSCDEREALNRTRTWLNCYCVDGSHAIQFGKMPMLPPDDYLARNSRHWYKSSALNTPFDVHLCAFVQMIIHMVIWMADIKADTPKLTDQPKDFVGIATRTREVLIREMDIWVDIFAEEYMCMPHPVAPICSYRANTTQMINAYLRLVVLLVGFQKTTTEELRPDSEVLVKSVDAARSVIKITLEHLYPTGYLRYAIEATFLYVSFAAAFLINLFRPRFSSLLGDSLQKEIITTVSRLIATLGSSDVALDGRHTPALYSRFLSSLMIKHNLTLSDPDLLRKDHSRSSSFQTGDRQVTPPEGFYWPDVPGANNPGHGHAPQFSKGFGYELQPEVNMDFSLSHFIKSVTQQTPPPDETELPYESRPMWKANEIESIQSAPWSQRPITASGGWNI